MGGDVGILMIVIAVILKRLPVLWTLIGVSLKKRDMVGNILMTIIEYLDLIAQKLINRILVLVDMREI